LIDRKKRFQNKDVQRIEDTQNGVTADGDIMERARAAGINPGPILQEIIKSVDSPKSDGICTNADVELMRKVLIERTQ
jgi:hypothetical protein